MVVDAVPEPAVVLDSAGYVMHANRMAEDLFGSRRRGGHVASMSRDPELLEAVDRRSSPARRPPSSCTSACLSSGGCWRRSPRSTPRGRVRPAPRSSSRFAI
jgi:PAS domain-containing protein